MIRVLLLVLLFFSKQLTTLLLGIRQFDSNVSAFRTGQCPLMMRKLNYFIIRTHIRNLLTHLHRHLCLLRIAKRGLPTLLLRPRQRGNKLRQPFRTQVQRIHFLSHTACPTIIIINLLIIVNVRRENY